MSIMSTPYAPVDDGRPVLVTGVAGFIGHHTAGLLLDRGCRVIGVDSFTDYYDRTVKYRNLDALTGRDDFRFIEADVRDPRVADEIGGVQAIVHLAAQPGVRDSWDDFTTYVDRNVLATKHVLDAALAHGAPRVVCASSSSVYGDAPSYPTSETAPTEPRSPYGITKLAAERLAVVYGRERGLQTSSLRYFTVYGPAQRPDMAIQRLIAAAVDGRRFQLFGDGRQVRDFTYVGDVANATATCAMTGLPPGGVYNVCSERPVTLDDVVRAVTEVIGEAPILERGAHAIGDVDRTGGTAGLLREAIGWEPSTSLVDGIRAQAREYARRRDVVGVA
jgi:UDP-glucuronate 4-epimerase